MKINKLTFSYFGPYNREETLDFNVLNKKGLFLLTGPTGVGKTSIFDALCFALYGQVTGQSNKVDKVVSDYKKETDLSYVELEFMLNDKPYFIHREPEQPYFTRNRFNPKRPQRVLFKTPDETYEKIQEVRDKVIEIVGLDVEQFKQIVMLPQGEFVKFLHSSSEDKMNIFRKLFDTLGAHKLEDDMKQSLSAVTKKQEINQTRIETLLESIDFDDVELDIKNYNESILTTKEVLLKKTEEAKLLESSLKQVKDNLDLKSKEYQIDININKSIEEYKATLLKYNTLKSSEDKINYIEQKVEYSKKAFEISAVESRLLDVSKKLDIQKNKLDKYNGEYEIKLKDLEVHNNSLSEYHENQKDKESLTKESAYLEENIKQAINKNKLLELKQQNLKKLNNLKEEQSLVSHKIEEYAEVDLTNLTASRNEYVSLLQELDSRVVLLNRDIEEIKSEILKYESIENYQKQIETKSKEVINNKNIKYNAEEKLLKIKKQILASEAAKLSVELKIGDLCPICGHTITQFVNLEEHELLSTKETEAEINKIDSLINMGQNTILEFQTKIDMLQSGLKFESKNSVKALLEEKEKELECVNKKSLEVNKVKQEIELSILKYQKELEERSKYEIKLSEIKEKIISLDTKDKSLEDEINRLHSLISLEESKNRQTEISSQLNNLNRQIAKYQQDDKDLNVSVNSLKEAIKQVDEQVKELGIEQSKIKQEFLEASKNFKDYKEYLFNTDLLNEYNKEVSQYYKNKNILESRLDSLIEFKNKSIVDLVPLEAEIAELDKLYQDKNKSYGEFSERLNRNTINYKSIVGVYRAVKDNIEYAQKLYNLTALLRGKNAEHIDFERFLILAYYDDVLLEANKKLKVLSKNRYALIRKEEIVGGGVKGLDLNISDTYTGHLRDVKTLSGGESFLCALALALGLSESVKQNNGGINLETIFIDEGFGSLSEDSLELVVDILNSIRGDGYSVGIISHVESLKEIIPTKIILDRNKDGSYIKEIIS